MCPWSLAYMTSIIPILGLERVCPWKACPWPWPRIFFCVLGLEPCVLDSTFDKLSNCDEVLRTSYSEESCGPRQATMISMTASRASDKGLSQQNYLHS